MFSGKGLATQQGGFWAGHRLRKAGARQVGQLLHSCLKTCSRSSKPSTFLVGTCTWDTVLPLQPCFWSWGVGQGEMGCSTFNNEHQHFTSHHCLSTEYYSNSQIPEQNSLNIPFYLVPSPKLSICPNVVDNT